MKKQKLSDRDQKLVDGWIKELDEKGFTPDEMAKVFRMARKKYEELKRREHENRMDRS